MIGALAPRPSQPKAEDRVTVPHVAVGIWVGLIAVLVLPSMNKQRHRITEAHLLRAYSTAMTAFGLL